MPIRTLPVTASDRDIRSLVVEWSETIAQGKFAEALEMFPFEGTWSAELLQRTIQGYGVPQHDESLLDMLEMWEVKEFRITSIHGRNDATEFIEKHIVVDRDHLYGLDPTQYLGMVHYNDVPLSGYISDLTARFHLKRVDGSRMTLEFLDIHVM
jgi:hypothetical protein